ncbi:MAG: DMT family transporter [Rhodospirillales bacterium]|nr:DMT family transporter [Rhodospirillales bacterium]
MTEAGIGANARGILWMMLAVFIYVLSDALIKHLTESYPLIQVLWARFVFHAAFVALLVRHRLIAALKSRRPGMQLARAALQFTAALLFVVGLSTLPLADVNALYFAGPLIVTALSVPLLGEHVGLRRWIAVGVGFAGVLAIVRPGAGVVDPVALLILAAAVAFALYQITTRIVGRVDSTMTSLAVIGLFGSCVTSAIVPFVWQSPDLGGWVLMVTVGITAGMSHFAQIRALETAPAAVVVPFTYTSLVWATLFGFLGWGHFPDAWTIAGAVVIAGAGLYIFHRERVNRDAV